MATSASRPALRLVPPLAAKPVPWHAYVVRSVLAVGVLAALVYGPIYLIAAVKR
ncbi:hypothetical protein SAMN05444157_1595 [Frankineae bacterium MT45]|nr:hypothetical protein SAMN05444157_1595 [Frankineae bacterium MT45]